MDNKRKRREQGFTLLEILAVLFIIGLIAAIVAAATLSHIDRATYDTTKASMLQIKQQLQIYKMYQKKYPVELRELIPEYIEDESALKDGWGNDFYYQAPGDSHDFDLISGGSDGDSNTMEDNIDIWTIRKENDQNAQ
jgi:general secretion pathway protein G